MREGKNNLTKIKRRLCIAIAAAILVLFGWLLIRPSEFREPSYQGRTLTDWRTEFGQTHIGLQKASQIDPRTVPSFYAIRKIGTNAFPFLLHELAAQDSALRAKVAAWVNARKWNRLKIKPAIARQIRAASTFVMLKDLADPVVPDLIELTKSKDPNTRNSALMVLWRIEPKKQIFLPVLLRLIHDPDEAVRQNAAFDLHDLFPDEAQKVNLSQMFPGYFDDAPKTEPTNSIVPQ